MFGLSSNRKEISGRETKIIPQTGMCVCVSLQHSKLKTLQDGRVKSMF